MTQKSDKKLILHKQENFIINPRLRTNISEDVWSWIMLSALILIRLLYCLCMTSQNLSNWHHSVKVIIIRKKSFIFIRSRCPETQWLKLPSRSSAELWSSRSSTTSSGPSSAPPSSLAPGYYSTNLYFTGNCSKKLD